MAVSAEPKSCRASAVTLHGAAGVRNRDVTVVQPVAVQTVPRRSIRDGRRVVRRSDG